MKACPIAKHLLGDAGLVTLSSHSEGYVCRVIIETTALFWNNSGGVSAVSDVDFLAINPPYTGNFFRMERWVFSGFTTISGETNSLDAKEIERLSIRFGGRIYKSSRSAYRAVELKRMKMTAEP